MESLNLLSCWRNGGRAAAKVLKTTTALSSSAKQYKMDDADDGPFFDLLLADDGPFFDLHFAVTADGRHRLSLSDTSSDLFSHRRLPAPQPNSIPRLQFPVTLTTSPTTKLRVLMKQQQQQQNISKFPIKVKVEELPLASLFTRDNTSRSGDDDRRLSKEALQKYVSKIKPLYVGISKRYGEMLKLSGLLGFEGGVAGDRIKSPKAGMRVAGRRFGKSKSAPSPFAAMQAVQAERVDDSLWQQEDGIRSAIAHCKQSFTAAAGGVGRSISDVGRSRLTSHPAFPVLIGSD